MKDLSIVIVAWNCKKFVLECLDTLNQPSGLFTEVILVDNASSDRTPEAVRLQFSNVKVVANSMNLGFAKANNIGIRFATGSYICLINPDVKVLDGCLDQMVSYLDRNPDVGMLGPAMLEPGGRVGRSYMRFPTLWNSFCRALALDTLFKRFGLFGGQLMTDFRPQKVSDVEVLNGWFLMVRRQALQHVGLLDERFFMYGEDIDWCRRFHEAGWRIVYFPLAQAIHYGAGSSSNAPVRFFVEMHRANLEFWKKYHTWRGQINFLAFAWLHHVIRIVGYSLLWTVSSSSRSHAAFKVKRSIAYLGWLRRARLPAKVKV